MAERKDPEKFAEEVKAVNPFIVLLEKYQKSNKSISCRCSICGFPGEGIWKPVPHTLLKPKACPMCDGRQLNALFKGFNDLETWCKKNNRLDILADWDYDENKKDARVPNSPNEIARSDSKIFCHWKCHVCGTPWHTTPNQRTSPNIKTKRTAACPHCSKAGTSFTELALIYYLRLIFPDIIIRSREIIGKELDIYLPSCQIAIECDGYVYHKEKLGAENKKDVLCKENGIQLIRFRDPRLPKTEHAIIVDASGIHDSTGFKVAMQQTMALCGVREFPDINIQRDYGNIISDYKRTVQEHSLLAECPEIAKEWHPTKNGVLLPENFTPGEDYCAWWKCSKCGHSWQAHIYSRTGKMKQGCPKCSLKRQGHTYRRNRARRMSLEQWCNNNNMNEILLDWDYEANLKDPSCPDTPKDCPYGSPRPVHWACHVCGNKWPAAPTSRRERKGNCKKCSGRLLVSGQNDLKTWCQKHNRQDLIDEWDYEKNKFDPMCPDLPEETRYNQTILVHWECHLCGNKWTDRVNDRTNRNFHCRNCTKTIRAKAHQKRVRNIDTGEVFDSILDAELQTSGKKGTCICQCCKGVRKTAYGYHWEYVDR